MGHMRFSNEETTVHGGVAGLSTANQLVLWSLRHWFRCFSEGASATEHLDQAYGYAHARKAVAPFELAMMLFVAGHQRGLSVHLPHCQGVSRDELAFQSLIEAFQNRDAHVAHKILNDMIIPAARRIIWQPLSDYANALSRAGMAVRTPQPGPNSGLKPDREPMAALAILSQAVH
ncbi:MAG: hypothetical protein NXI16_07095 [Alphaproteobacteria bacterium]|nr:hypothetical protein [Alphaproteobacteria bacterium]